MNNNDANAKQRELCHLLNSTIYFLIRSVIDTFIMTNKNFELIFKKTCLKITKIKIISVSSSICKLAVNQDPA